MLVLGQIRFRGIFSIFDPTQTNSENILIFHILFYASTQANIVIKFGAERIMGTYQK